MSTIVVFRKDIADLVTGVFAPGERGAGARSFAGLILLSMVPVGVVGLMFKDAIEARLDGHLGAVGAALLVTAALLFWSQRRGREEGAWASSKRGSSAVHRRWRCCPDQPEWRDDFCGPAAWRGPRGGGPLQLLMVLPPILGATLLEVKDLMDPAVHGGPEASGMALAVGAVAAFFSGWWACRTMMALVKRNGFNGFAVYCAVVGVAALILGS